MGENFHNKPFDAEIAALVDSVYARGWGGIMYWGADRQGDKMIYYFKSPFLETQSWAEFKGDGLTPLVKAAHAKGIKVIINIEGVDPYHWKQNHWTPVNIRSVARDLAASGVDAVHEECFEVKPEVFISLAAELRSHGIEYVSGTDAMIMREPYFSTLWPGTGIIDLYDYYLKRDKIFGASVLAQNGTLGYGWAKYWNLPSSLMSPVERNWGISMDYSPAVVTYMCMIRALQFRVDDYFILHGFNEFDPVATQNWISEYVNKQEQNRQLLDIVVLLKTDNSKGGNSERSSWNRLLNSGDAITSGAFNAGFNVIVSDKVIPADAYWIYANGGEGDILPEDVVALFSTGKPVFIQCGSGIPSGSTITPGWENVLKQCGINGKIIFGYGGLSGKRSEASLPGNQDEEIPYTGYYKDVYLRFTGSDTQRGTDLRSGTVIPNDAITGTIFCESNKTYGRGPYITGKNNKYVVTATTLNWEVAYPVSDLLSGCGILPSSNVWGIAGRNVTALIAIETTELVIKIPGVPEGTPLRVVIWDNMKKKKSEETVVYKAPLRHLLNEYDFILIDSRNK
jgi:hypothetical protein